MDLPTLLYSGEINEYTPEEGHKTWELFMVIPWSKQKEIKKKICYFTDWTTLGDCVKYLRCENATLSIMVSNPLHCNFCSHEFDVFNASGLNTTIAQHFEEAHEDRFFMHLLNGEIVYGTLE